MSAYYEIYGTVVPKTECADAVLSILDSYGIEYRGTPGSAEIAIGMNDYRSGGMMNYLRSALQGLITSAKITAHVGVVDDSYDSAYVFADGKWCETWGESYLFFPGVDDPWTFAQSLPDSVKQAILEHAEEFVHE